MSVASDMDKHGAIRAMDESVYRSYPALSSTEARLLIKDVPARVQWLRESPVDTDSVLLGQIAHGLLLEEDKTRASLVVVDNFVSKANKLTRDKALSEGHFVVKTAQMVMLEAMLVQQRKDDWAGRFFQQGEAEIVLRWQCVETGVECKARVDWLPVGYSVLADFKTAAAIDDHSILSSIKRYGYYQQLAFYCEGMRTVFEGDFPKAVLLFQEKRPPYPCRVVELTSRQIELGYDLNMKAKLLYKNCVLHGHWPAYAPTTMEFHDSFYQLFE